MTHIHCCFCEKILEDRGASDEQQITIYSCCPDCLMDDPRARTFRTRKRQLCTVAENHQTSFKATVGGVQGRMSLNDESVINSSR